jgi:hypothetical protein
MRKVENIITIIMCLLFVWVAVSYADVVINNLDGGTNKTWNLIYILYNVK